MINLKFLLQPHQKYYITQYGELGFSYLTQMKDDYTTNSHYLTYTFLRFWSKVCRTPLLCFHYRPLFELGRLRECTFWTWEWKGSNLWSTWSTGEPPAPHVVMPAPPALQHSHPVPQHTGAAREPAPVRGAQPVPRRVPTLHSPPGQVPGDVHGWGA